MADAGADLRCFGVAAAALRATRYAYAAGCYVFHCQMLELA